VEKPFDGGWHGVRRRRAESELALAGELELSTTNLRQLNDP